jgi:hypothetical protein
MKNLQRSRTHRRKWLKFVQIRDIYAMASQSGRVQ